MAVVVPLIAFPLLLAFWVFVGWRVRVEQGRVLESPFVRFTQAMRRLELALGVALVPVVRHAVEQMVAWNRALEAATAEFGPDLPEGHYLDFDTTALLPDGDE